MKSTLIYNPNSGGADRIAPETLVQALYQAGYDPVYRATSSEEDLDHLLSETTDLVVAAGGDGTMRAVATRLIGKDLPLALVPMGTANNIARTFELSGDPLEIIAGLQHPVKRPFDVGCVSSPWGVDYFLESFGFGLYARGLDVYDADQGKSVVRSVTSAIETLANFFPVQRRITLDGEDLSGKYLIFEALNTTAFGPRVKFAPDADPGDGLLDVVGIREENRDPLHQYFTKFLQEEMADLPSVEARRGRSLKIAWPDAEPFHIDAEVRPNQEHRSADLAPALGLQVEDVGNSNGFLRVEILPGVLQLWLPGPIETPEEESE